VISALLKHKSVILYGICLALLLFLMRWLELRYLIFNLKLEVFVGAIAIVFMALGIWLTLKLAKPKKETIVVEKEVYVTPEKEFVLNETELERLNLSKRELEVLQLMAEGLSNAEIADRLFVSLNTIKTHSSKVFEKLEVKRRTQAVETAKRLNLIP
jgi:ATP/maltotriose-dependent transcriptional regulator MalT